MKICLIFPPSIYQTKQMMPPLGIAWIAAVLRENGYKDVILIDGDVNKYSNQEAVDLLEKAGPDIIGFSFGTQNRFNAFSLISAIREKFPDLPLVAGGPHPTLTYESILEEIPELDIIVRGEGEYTFLELVKTIDKRGELRDIAGISFRSRNGSVVHNNTREQIGDLDSLPMPARDLLPIDKYQQKIPMSDRICTNFISARGCPYSCVYCSAAKQAGHKIRHRSPDHVISEIKHIVKEYGIN